MLKFILFTLIFAFISSKEISSIINYAVDIPFNIENKRLILNFEYDGDKDDPIIIYAQPDYDDFEFIFNLKSALITTYIYANKRGEGTVTMAFSKDIEIKLSYLQRNNGTGKFWINPCKNELEIDLSQKYGKMIPLVGFLINIENILTYVVKNLQKNYHVIFQYQTNFTYGNDTFYNISNPFVVCNEKECIGNITSFYFTKGKSYKILLKSQIVKDKTVLPGYTIYSDRSDDLNNNKYLRFNFLLILLNLILL